MFHPATIIIDLSNIIDHQGELDDIHLEDWVQLEHSQSTCPA